MTGSSRSQRIQTFCALCVARCGAVGIVEAGRFTRLEPDPSHPTGQALCAKGRAAPELVYSRERLTHPLRRTRPKGDADPGWERITWDEALDLTAAAMRRVAERDGPQADLVISVDHCDRRFQRLYLAAGKRIRYAQLSHHARCLRVGARLCHPLYFRCRQRRPRWDRGCNAGHRQ